MVIVESSYKFAVVAGILEGEGTFSIAKARDKRRSSDYFNFHACVVIANSNIKLLEFCKSVIGGRIYEKVEPHGTYPFHKKVFDLRLGGLTRIANELQNLIPFLITKSMEAELLKEFCLSRIENRSNNGYSKRELEIYSILCSLHSKGRKPHKEITANE